MLYISKICQLSNVNHCYRYQQYAPRLTINKSTCNQ